MIKIYSLKKDGDKKLSPHFKVREFRSKDGADLIYIDTALVDTLEKVRDHFDCSKINLASAYRTASHDKRVGGRGYGAHVEGKAADFTAFNKDGSRIKSRELVLYLEDIGIKGIGYRSGGSEYSTHCDVNYRTRNWFGDEKYSNTASVGTFYDYLGVKYKNASVTASALNVRREPTVSSGSIKTVYRNSRLAVADTVRINRDGYTWCRVKIDGNHYWVAERYLRF